MSELHSSSTSTTINTPSKQVTVIGGGAAGFFAAISAKQHHPDYHVRILEKSKRVLGKVKISGGGRCNVTNACSNVRELVKAYPRGSKLLSPLLKLFNTSDTQHWFESRGVELVTQDDQCVFPRSQDSQTIIDCLLNECRTLGIEIITQCNITKLTRNEDSGQWMLHAHQDDAIEIADTVIVTTGGSPKHSGLDWLAELGHQIESPVPSLFTFNMPDEPIRNLMGIVINPAQVSIVGAAKHKPLKNKLGLGPLLLTHWGMSGPAVLVLSAFGARWMAEQNYEFSASINWANETNQSVVLSTLEALIDSHPKKQLKRLRPFSLPDRLWLFLLDKIDLPADKPWGELGQKQLNKLINILTNDHYPVRGKTTFKEEFVTCGGVSLASINNKTLASKVQPNLYFAGEVLDIDGITGGYNFQSAWTTGFIAGKLL